MRGRSIVTVRTGRNADLYIGARGQVTSVESKVEVARLLNLAHSPTSVLDSVNEVARFCLGGWEPRGSESICVLHVSKVGHGTEICKGTDLVNK